MNGSLFRLLDANTNRAREALRVLEDYARFVLNIESLSADLKNLRHALADATKPFSADAILHRDTAGDVGTETKVQAELVRDDLSHVVIAAGKRLGEALRALEEFAKVDFPPSAKSLERIRYQFYDLETTISRTLKPANRLAEVRLCVLITESLCQKPWLDVVHESIEGGADCLQLREKDMEAGEFLHRAIAFVNACRLRGIISIINDRPDIALLSNADGVHVGQGDLPAIEARKLLGNEKIIGVSTHTLTQARQALLDGADYIGVGPVFPSQTKPRDFLPGLAFATQVATEIPLPAMAIAGITLQNVDEVLATGIKTIAVSSAVISSKDPASEVRLLRKKLEKTPPMVGQTFLSASSGHSSPDDHLRKSRRRLPHWQINGSTYFLTFRTRDNILTPEERNQVLQHIISGHNRFYDLSAVVVLPDHAHIVLRPNDGYDLPRIMTGIKGVSARIINESRNQHQSIWQDESFDRIIRDPAEFEEKLQYMVNNPVKAGLVQDAWDYPALWVNQP